MLSKAIAQKVEKVMGYFGERQREKAKKDPEACVLSMLTRIEEELPEVSAMLYSSIELTTSDDYLQEARKEIKQAEKSS
ncbi:MAG TPA: hypothetical protein VI937_03745 [Negativicutes bacterium]|nr:hypothetical protein [Negativicutes bacterium]